MLVLSRKVGESINIDGQIKIKVQKIKGNRVVLGIDAPGDVAIVRSELRRFIATDTDERTPTPSEWAGAKQSYNAEHFWAAAI